MRSVSQTTFSSIPTLLLIKLQQNLPFEALLWALTFVTDKFIQGFVLTDCIMPT